MKKEGNLYDTIISPANLRLADEKARKGKFHTYGVQVHDRNKEANLLQLHEQLKNQTFKTSDYNVFKIYEPKERDIYQLPYFPDRIVHHAVMNVLEPIWVSIFTRDTYSCIKGRGIHAAAQSVKMALRNDPEGTVYCLKIDIKKFYPSIDHEILKQLIARRIKDKRLLWLLGEIIDSVPDGEGVPIGNYLSQYFANLYLAYFDHWMKEVKQVKHYWRYADDIVVLSGSKEYLHNLLDEMHAYLHDNLKLKIKENWQVFPVESRGVDFVGYVFKHSHTLMRKSIKQTFARKVASLNKREGISENEYLQALCPWWGWALHCDSNNLINKFNKTSKYEIKF